MKIRKMYPSNHKIDRMSLEYESEDSLRLVCYWQYVYKFAINLLDLTDYQEASEDTASSKLDIVISILDM